ncbi:hypothetical protein [Thiohalobacter sp.]|uniref:hypothetical protein n=1 Tax=Thiohalobacter sp. TaxID=2025948 RepID=UPI002602D43A|nr:hypothetical protein [Thiohalobacter sp.]
MKKPSTAKLAWQGRLLGVQPRIRLLRSFDERTHNYLGYVLRIEGSLGDETGEFLVAIGKAAQEKHRFQAGMVVSGASVPVADPRMETAGYYKTSGLKVLEEVADEAPAGPPFHGVPPDLPTYRARGHRRLDPRTYEAKCTSCIWGCRMPVELLIDPWNPSYRYRFETFCYGPKSCMCYKAGAPRKVPGRKGMTWVEEDWVDEEETAHRGPDE